jgi:hypothetical protein
MAFVRSPDGISVELLQAGGALAPAEPWASMPNTGSLVAGAHVPAQRLRAARRRSAAQPDAGASFCHADQPGHRRPDGRPHSAGVRRQRRCRTACCAATWRAPTRCGNRRRGGRCWRCFTGRRPTSRPVGTPPRRSRTRWCRPGTTPSCTRTARCRWWKTHPGCTRWSAASPSHHEAARAQPWAVGDAPPDFIQSLLRAIVGIEIPLTRVLGKFKLSQNRSAADRAGVVTGLATDSPEGGATAALMHSTLSQETPR